jgi:hypothetical protein
MVTTEIPLWLHPLIVITTMSIRQPLLLAIVGTTRLQTIIGTLSKEIPWAIQFSMTAP